MKCSIEIDVQIKTRSTPKRFARLSRQIVGVALNHLPKTVTKKNLHPRGNYTLNIAILGASQMASLNKKYRRKNYATDVLSFSNLPAKTTLPTNIGDILICWTVLQKQARSFQHSQEEELAQLLIHGTLHLFGYDHELGPKEEKRMFQLQEKIFKKWWVDKY